MNENRHTGINLSLMDNGESYRTNINRSKYGGSIES